MRRRVRVSESEMKDGAPRGGTTTNKGGGLVRAGTLTGVAGRRAERGPRITTSKTQGSEEMRGRTLLGMHRPLAVEQTTTGLRRGVGPHSLLANVVHHLHAVVWTLHPVEVDSGERAQIMAHPGRESALHPPVDARPVIEAARTTPWEQTDGFAIETGMVPSKLCAVVNRTQEITVSGFAQDHRSLLQIDDARLRHPALKLGLFFVMSLRRHQALHPVKISLTMIVHL